MTKEEAIKHLHTYSSTNGSGLTTQDQHEEAKKMAIKALETQLRWIPCSEQMPKEKDAGILKKLGTNRLSDYVIATVEVKGERMTVIIRTHDGVWHWDKKYAFPDYKVVAWMPLPKPWEGGQDGD